MSDDPIFYVPADEWPVFAKQIARYLNRPTYSTASPSGQKAWDNGTPPEYKPGYVNCSKTYSEETVEVSLRLHPNATKPGYWNVGKALVRSILSARRIAEEKITHNVLKELSDVCTSADLVDSGVRSLLPKLIKAYCAKRLGYGE